MPDTEFRLGDSRGCDRAPLAIHDRVEAEVVLEGIGAHEEIVLAVLRAKDDAAARVLSPGHGSKAHRDVGVRELLVFQDRHGPGLGLDRLREHLAILGWAPYPLPRDEFPLRIFSAEIVFHRGPLPGRGRERCRRHQRQQRQYAFHPAKSSLPAQSRRSVTTFQSSPLTKVTSATGAPASRLGIALTARYSALALTAAAVASASERFARP